MKNRNHVLPIHSVDRSRSTTALLLALVLCLALAAAGCAPASTASASTTASKNATASASAPSAPAASPAPGSILSSLRPQSESSESAASSGSGSLLSGLVSQAASAQAAGGAGGVVILNGIKPAASPSLTLETYSSAGYSVSKPKSWAIETTGTYANFGFRMYDPANPARQIFFYGNMTPFMKSAQAKTFWASYVNNSGFPQARIYSEAPVLFPATTRQFFSKFNEFATLAVKYGIKHSFPSLASFEVLESAQRNSPMAAVALDDSLLRALFVQNGVLCEGQFAAAVVDAMKYPVNGLDAGYITSYAIAGISAPADEFMHIEKTLAEAIGSFQFTQAYIDQGVAQKQWETAAALQTGRTLQQAYDSYNRAWWARQKSYDIMSQQRSDATLGYTRLYDPATGKTYRADADTLAAYKQNPQKFGISNLQAIPSGSSDLYGAPISGYLTK